MYKRCFLAILFAAAIQLCFGKSPVESLKFFAADHPFIRYTGRIDFTNPKLPRFWQPGVYMSTIFSGTRCEVILHDEMLWGKNYNYIEVVVDDKPIRLQTRGKRILLS